MPLGDHLRELRRRIVLSALGILVAAIGGWVVYPFVVNELEEPLQDIGVLNFTTVGQGFDLRIQVSLLLGLFASSPWWIGQIWMFVAPGLTRKEKTYALAFIFAGALLFIGGGALAWWVLPHAVEILTAFTPENAVNYLEARVYFSFFMKVMIVFGVAFLLPEVMVGLNFLGVVRAKTFLKAWRWAVLVAFAFTAIANPLPDVWSMIVMGGSISALFFLAIGICFLRDRYVDKRRAALDAKLDEALGE